MKKKFALVCLFALLLSACSTTTDRAGDKPSKPRTVGTRDMPELPLPDDTMTARAGARALQVYVVAGEGTEDVSIDEEPIHRKRHNRNNVVFRLRSAGYMFPPTDAVTFDDIRTSPPDGEITCTTTTSGSWRYLEVSCTNDGIQGQRTPGRYKYTLHLLRADGTPLELLDPFIVNH